MAKLFLNKTLDNALQHSLDLFLVVDKIAASVVAGGSADVFVFWLGFKLRRFRAKAQFPDERRILRAFAAALEGSRSLHTGDSPIAPSPVRIRTHDTIALTLLNR